MERKTEYPINELFLERWSPRAIFGEISKEELMTILEAARWAPSSYNNQPWRFIYGLKGTEAFDKLAGLLFDGNSWAKNTGALVLVVSKTTFDYNGQKYKTHTLESGSAWQNAALQSTDMGLAAHGLGGFDYEKARKEFSIPDDFSVDMMFCIGKPTDKEDLPQALKDMEGPSDRKPLSKIAFEGEFKL